MVRKSVLMLLLFLAIGCILVSGPEDAGSRTKPVATVSAAPAPDASAPALVSDEEWRAISASYDYDRSIPLNVEIKEKKDFPAFTKVYFSYDGINGCLLYTSPSPRDS